VPGALAIVLIGYAEALGGQRPRQCKVAATSIRTRSLVAYGPANILSGLLGGFLVVGSPVQDLGRHGRRRPHPTRQCRRGGLLLPHAGFVDAVVPGHAAPALAAIVIAAMLHLSRPGYLRDLLARDPREFAVAATVVAGELMLGVLHGIALGVALSLLMLIYRTSHPQGAVLGQLPGTEAYRDVKRHPEALTFPGLLIWRAGGELFFASIGHLGRGG